MRGGHGHYNPEGDWVPNASPPAAWSPVTHAMLRAVERRDIEKDGKPGRFRRADGAALTRDEHQAVRQILNAHWISWQPLPFRPMSFTLMPAALEVLAAWDREHPSTSQQGDGQ